MANVMLTTVDNPYNPFTHFDEWMAFDELHALQENRPTCCGYLAMMVQADDDISDNEYAEIVEETIDDIVELNLTGKFMKITEEDAKELM